MTSHHRASRVLKRHRDSNSVDPFFYRRPTLAAIARQLLDEARRRREFLPGAVLDDPQWWMALDLFVASEEGRTVTVSALCLASGVPPTTALRHIRHMQTYGIVERISHPHDRRISNMRLTEDARRQVARYLASVGSRSAVIAKSSASSAAY